jgi:hypothetical protein
MTLVHVKMRNETHTIYLYTRENKGLPLVGIESPLMSFYPSAAAFGTTAFR